MASHPATQMLPMEWMAMQVFVANPNKSPEVVQILTGNKDRLLRYLGDFHTDKGALLP